MKVNFFSILVVLFVAAVFTLGCEKDDDSIPQDPDDPEVEVDLIDTLVTLTGVEFVRTPDDRFDNLPDWPYAHQYVEIDGLRQAYVEAGPADGEVVLLLHGQPSWSYLYRKMIPVLADAGYRVIAMDHLGFGRSDKPVDISSYSYLGHYDRMVRFIELLNLGDINLFAQDWGAVLGLRVVGMNPDWFKRVVLGNGNLPFVPAGTVIYPPVENPNEIIDVPSFFDQYTPQQEPYFDNCVRLIDEFDFAAWMVYAMKARSFTASEAVEGWTWFEVTEQEKAAYDAPFPSRAYMAGARVFPSLLNETAGVTQEAWMGLASFQKPFLTIFGANDPLDLGECALNQALIDNIPGAAGQPHYRYPDASHFLQSDQGEDIAQRMIDFFNGDYSGGNFGDTPTPVAVCESDTNDDPRRYCEFLLMYQKNGEVYAEVWGTQGLTNCPQGCLEDVDLEAVKAENGAFEISLNGPRIWMPDGQGELPPSDPRYFGTLEVRLLARVPIDPNDPQSSGIGLGDPYKENLVNRNTVYQYPAGSEVYELTSPDSSIYTMQSFSLIVSLDLTADDLPNLDSILQLPNGWTYQARTLSDELVLTADGEAFVVTDDLGNTYQRRTF